MYNLLYATKSFARQVRGEFSQLGRPGDFSAIGQNSQAGPASIM